MPLRTMVLGLGRAGAGLHLPVLAKARDLRPRLFAPEPVIAFDRDPAERARAAGDTGLRVVDSLARARESLDPEHTVVHICTPPLARAEVVAELLRLGFRRLLLEKPLAAGPRDLARLVELVGRPGVQATVVAPWLASTLTDRLIALVEERPGLGALRQISVVQDKPRFQRTLATSGHPTAFDIEIPHALGVLLRLAGDAEVVGASCTDLDVDGRRLPRLGGAEVRLAHRDGVLADIRSDLTSPVRERRITLGFDGGTAVGHYPADAGDHYAQLRLTTPECPAGDREVFRDDALTAFMLRAYADFAGDDGPCPTDFARQARVVGLLTDAKNLAAPPDASGPRRELAGAR
ncbi:Gfo/Idh/MocA family oxidoreductase [Streptomyces sp. NPDC093221]|uniref:Gfo/Idh/MocA family oxidoreductase n=1 Tax=Streptomyces sp. NPDC093221 TaxID=3366032 RepID=UPI0038288F06